MKNIYHSDIMECLLKAGREGMRVCRLVRNIYNQHTDLFAESLDYTDLYQCIYRYLWVQARRRGTPFMRPRRGTYAIKPNIAVQLDIFVDLVPEASPRPRERKRGEGARQLTIDFEAPQAPQGGM